MFEVRPLTSFAAKSIGDTLRPYFSKGPVLDLFAGLGSFSQIALQNGAEEITAVENHPKTFQELKTNLRAFSNARALQTDVHRFLESTTNTFFLIFADPPYPLWSNAFQEKFLPLVPPKLQKNGIFAVRHPRKVILLTEFFKIPFWKQKKIGESYISYFRNEVEE